MNTRSNVVRVHMFAHRYVGVRSANVSQIHHLRRAISTVIMRVPNSVVEVPFAYILVLSMPSETATNKSKTRPTECQPKSIRRIVANTRNICEQSPGVQTRALTEGFSVRFRSKSTCEINFGYDIAEL